MNKDTIELEEIIDDDLNYVELYTEELRAKVLAWHNKKAKEARIDEAKTLRAYFYQFSWGHYDPIAIFNDRISDLKSNKE